MKEKILIVDDTPANLQVLVGFLSGCGYQLMIADDGLAALEQLSHTPVDLILLDVAMPEMDGFETCRRIKQLSNSKNTPVLFLTARSEISEKLKGFASGGVDYITKPIQKDEVIARIQAHLTIVRQGRQLEELLEQRQRFMRIAAHDLRNLLAVIVGFAQVGKEWDNPETKRLAFDRIGTACENMQAIIEGFLSLPNARSESEPHQVFELRELIEQVIDQSAFGAQCKHIALTRRLPEGSLAAFGNLAHTHQILTNYVTNAIKYSPRNTHTLLSTFRRGEFWRVEVQDQGPGVLPEERENLFVEFGSVSNKPTGGESSTGVGLSIVKSLAERQGGTVGAEFPPDGGSIFWFEIPAANGVTGRVPAVQALAAPSPQSRSV